MALHESFKKVRSLRLGLFSVSAFCFVWGSARHEVSAIQGEPPATAEQAEFFESKIRPILNDNCFVCHGKDTQSGSLRLDSRSAMIKGGTNGTALVPGDPDKSLLIVSVRQTGKLKMPAGGRLKPNEVADLESWVKMGAPWPAGSGPKTEPKKLWSLKPVVKPAIPKLQNAKWASNPIDNFVAVKMAENKLNPAVMADARTLIRRVTYDLTGLPPTPQEVDSFISDKSPNAYEKVVDRLLASPRYGERWARLWLDVARYADTKGYVFEEDRNYPNAYTYRDWVIQAFNNDLPYNQFVIQQLAADLVPEVQTGDDKKPLAALGFLTVGRRFLNSQQDIIDDRIDVTMRGLQGFTVACARCHDHKFDPIPTQDYYSLYSVFSSSHEEESPISEKSIRDPWNEYTRKVSTMEGPIKELVYKQTMLLANKAKLPNAKDLLPKKVLDTLQTIRTGETPNADKLSKIRESFETEQLVKLSTLEKALEDVKAAAPTRPELAMAMADNQNPGDGYVFKRGNPGNNGGPAPRRFLKALSPSDTEREHWTKGSGRLQLANAIASDKNPLTARVFVNRIWMHHFGAGLVRTPSDFGNQGEKPSHPELLDYLASSFMENGWSIKKLHRMIVTSSTYKQSSVGSPTSLQTDPDNRWLSHMTRRRLDLEQMRDSVLSSGNQLNLATIGGKSVDLWSQPFSNRRSVYGFIERQNLPGIFRTFDFASPDATSPRRFFTTVPQQALFFMNSPFLVDMAKAVATRREVTSAPDEVGRVKAIYKILLDRLPTASELTLATQYLRNNDSATVPTPSGTWMYGYGSYDAEKRQTGQFSPYKTFDGGGYHVSSTFPDPNLGYLVLNAFGGHPGHDAAHATVRRWIAPESGTFSISGQIIHRQGQGDGIRARIISSRGGLLGEWNVHNRSESATVSSVTLKEGDSVDFMVDPMASDSFDSFEWSPTVRRIDGGKVWDSRKDFGPPPPPPLSRLTLYAQALMMTNEFMFID